MKLLVLVGALLVSSVCFGRSICEDKELESQSIKEEGYGETIIRLAAEGCFQNKTIEPQKTIVKLLPDTEDSESRVRNLIKALQYLEGYAESQMQVAETEAHSWASVRAGVAGLLIEAEAAMSSSAGVGEAETSLSIFHTDDWRLGVRGSGAGIAPIVGDLTVGFELACPQNRPAECSAYQERKALASALHGGQRIVSYSGAGTDLVHLADSRLALKKWDAYFNEAQFQWWWEIAINGWRMEKQDLCDQDPNKPGRQGFCTVPDDQLIFMHPNVALHWVDGADNSGELNGAFIVKVLGKNSWEWAPDGSMYGARGLSLVVAHTDLDESDNWGYGLMYDHNNRFSLGVISTDGEIGAILTVDLAKYLFERKKKYKDFMAATEKPGFWKEVLFAD